MNAANCRECGGFYTKNVRGMCLDCAHAFDQALEACTRYLWRNRKATMADVVEATGIAEKRVTRFIRESRILLHEFPNLAYACELCSSPTRSGKVCTSCSVRIQQDVLQMKNEMNKTPPRVEPVGAFKISDRIAPRRR